jgi:hypothetical protein
MCRIEKNPIMISPYPIFEVNKLPHDEICKILNINHIFNIICPSTANKLSIWNSCFRILFGCNSTFEHPAYLNSGKKWCGSIYLLSFWGNYSCAPSEIYDLLIFQDLNINKSYFCKFYQICKNMIYWYSSLGISDGAQL